jgi:hypothetical protein
MARSLAWETPLGEVLRPELDYHGAVLEVGSKLLLWPGSVYERWRGGGPRTLRSSGPAGFEQLCETCWSVLRQHRGHLRVACYWHALHAFFVDMFAYTPWGRPSSCTAASGDARIPSDAAARLVGVVFVGTTDTSVLRAISMFCTWTSRTNSLTLPWTVRLVRPRLGMLASLRTWLRDQLACSSTASLGHFSVACYWHVLHSVFLVKFAGTSRGRSLSCAAASWTALRAYCSIIRCPPLTARSPHGQFRRHVHWRTPRRPSCAFSPASLPPTQHCVAC